METLQPYVLGWLIPTVLAAIAGYLGGKVKHLTARDKAIEEGMKCILRAELSRAYETHVVDQKPITVDERRELDAIWHAYHDGLDGNGTGEWMYSELCELPLQIGGNR